MQKFFDQAVSEIFSSLSDREEFSTRKDVPQVLLAVSGGIDSMCMADLALHSSLDFRFAVAHCNFHLRGDESDSDTALVRDWCDRNGVQMYVADFDTDGFAHSNGLSIEMAARELRYRWFRQICVSGGYAGIVVAHNANDNAETLILNLLRGTGLKGLTGMGRISDFPYGPETADGARPMVLRPMLDFTRKQIEGYVRSADVVYHDDSTNADSSYKRNRIRNEVFPLFEKINPSFVRTLSRETGYFGEAYGLLGDISSVVRSEVLSADGRIDICSLLNQPHWPYLLYTLLEPYGFNSAAVASIEKLLKSRGRNGSTVSGKTFLSPDYILATSSDYLLVRKRDEYCVREDGCLYVACPGIYSFGSAGFSVDVYPVSYFDSFKCPAGTILMDAEKIPFPFICRRWRAGDWMRPLGMRGRKKVSDLFTDLKFDALAKSGALILTSDENDSHILAVAGKRIDDFVKVTDRTGLVVSVKLL